MDKNIKTLNFSRKDAINLINNYKTLFEDEKTYYDLETSIINDLTLLEQNIQNTDSNYNFETILFILKEKIMKFICEKIKQGDINLEIKIVEQYSKHSNSIKPRFDKLIVNNSKKESYEKYKQLTKSTDLEKNFIDKLWEDAIIETIDTYQGNNPFPCEIFKNFKNKLINIDTKFEQFTKNQQKIKTLI
ncbi:MAG: hypothetical protein GX247_03995 [Mollicutes bacterium]|nr:hypothetical protein [Mollicutes bacterium]